MNNIYIKNITSSASVYGRPTWRKIRQTFLDSYKDWYKINIDFTWIKTVTHSFTDELIGVFFFMDWVNAIKKIHFSNCNIETRKMIEFVIKERISNHNIENTK